MPVFEWHDGLSVGIDNMDNHHKRLIVLVNYFYDKHKDNAFSGKLDDASIVELLVMFDNLINYATYHFSIEETLMKKYSFPEIDTHIMEHKFFKYKIKVLYNNIKNRNSIIIIDILSFLQRWIIVHILNSDKQYGAFIVNNYRNY